MMDRRQFLRAAGAAAGAAGVTAGRLEAALAEQRAPAVSRRAADVVVVGAGAFGGWTALYLQRMGARVTLVDQYGPGNSRASSGDETRGVRTAYGTNEQWTWWASEAIRRWVRFDEQVADGLRMRLFYRTGDLICRAASEPFIDQTLATWRKLGIRHETLTGEEARRRFPQIGLDDTQVAILEHDAGVVRARRACEAVAEVFRQEGGTIVTAHARLEDTGARANHVTLQPGGALAAERFVFACGPWLWKVFPAQLGTRMRTPMGHVYYFGTPTGDDRFTWPNLPSFNFPGITGWAALTPDNRGFRVRVGGRPHSDPDTVERWIEPDQHARARDFLALRFPALKDAPLLETRACHYELSVTRNFIIDRLPSTENVWIAGAGNAEGFKQGPMVGEYIANRVLERPTAAALDALFAFPTEEYPPPTG
jgi:sarcosine oxidase